MPPDRTSAPGSSRPRSVGLVLRGIAMGTADLIPGVSGGTMALILGIYQELIASLGSLTSPEFLGAIARLHVRRAFRAANGGFLLAVVTGIAIAVLSLSRVMHALLSDYPGQVHAFFFGLILASAGLVGRKVGHWRPAAVIGAVAGAIGAFWLVGLTGAQTPNSLPILIASGALAICALMLPGISGAFILVLLGKYDTALSAVSRLDLAVVAPLGVGAVLGLLTFARVLAWLLRHFHDTTLAVLAGFMLGSLRKVWPFDGAAGHAAWPWHATGAWLLLLLLAIGAVTVVGLERAGAQHDT